MKDTIKHKRLQLQGEHFAQGAFSQVYKAKYNHTTVCVKKVRIKQSNDTSIIQREITLLRKSQHDNIVKFIGHCENDKNYYIVTEWIEGGNLRQYLKDYLIEITWEVRIKIAKGIAKGLQFLHDHGILHRDVKSRNILLERAKNKPKLCDFGFASEISDLDNTTLCGTGEWMAPELYNGTASNSDKIDIFSYGVVLIEIITRKNIARDLPRSSAANYGLDIELVKEHTPYDCPPALLELAISCCHFDPATRPQWIEILESLDNLRDSFPPSTPSCFDESDEGDNYNGSTTDNYADDDENEDNDDDEFAFSPPSSPSTPSYSSLASSSSTSSSSRPTIPPFIHQTTPQPSPGTSPSSSPHLSRNAKKTPTFRFQQLVYNRSGNISDSGSSSGGGSLRERILNRNNSNRGNILTLSSGASSSSPHTSPLTSPLTSPTISPTSTPRRQHPPPLFVSGQTTTSISEPNTPKGARSNTGSASALELPKYSLNDKEEEGERERERERERRACTQGKSNRDYARQLLRKIAPSRFSRSRSDPCITIHDSSSTPQDGAASTPNLTTLRPGMGARFRKRRDTGDSRTLRGSGEEERKDERKASPKNSPTQEYATVKEGEDEREEEESEREEKEEFIYGRAGLVRSSPEPSKHMRVNLALNIREDYEPDNPTPIKSKKTKAKPKRPLWKIIVGK